MPAPTGLCENLPHGHPPRRHHRRTRPPPARPVRRGHRRRHPRARRRHVRDDGCRARRRPRRPPGRGRPADLHVAARPTTTASRRAASSINPYLTSAKPLVGDPDPHEEVEGCLSVPGESFPLRRGESATLTGLGLDGNEIRYEATGWFARMLQHEYDHLNGFLYVDRLTASGRARRRRPSRATAGACPACRGCRVRTATRSATTTRRPRTSASTDVEPLVVGVVGPDRHRQVRPRHRAWRSGWAARSSAPTPRSSTAAWTSAPPSCPLEERRGIPHHQVDVLDVTEEATRRRLPARTRGPTSTPCCARGALPSWRAARGSTCGRRWTASRSRRPTRRSAAASRRGSTARAWPPCLPSSARVDPAAADAIEPNNGRRVVRALEVIALTGRPFSATMPTREFVRPTVLVGLRTDREALDARIDRRARADVRRRAGRRDPRARRRSACARDAPRAGRSATPRRSPSSTARRRSRMPSPTPRCGPGG